MQNISGLRYDTLLNWNFAIYLREFSERFKDPITKTLMNGDTVCMLYVHVYTSGCMNVDKAKGD